jgi:16S rRNA (uracil1498-N3)-methyltransferase
MVLPFFYKADIGSQAGLMVLDEATSKHVIQVLRMQMDEQLQLTDGAGNLVTAAIADDNRKRCAVKVISAVQVPQPTRKITIAISPVKNASRFEWFLEKVTEIGITEIIPLICERTEKQHFRQERMTGVLISAMLQSQQSWLPLLHEPVKFSQLITASQQQKFIAHCLEGDKKNLQEYLTQSTQPVPGQRNQHRPTKLGAGISTSANQLILIGPEGDFTPAEIAIALENNFVAVSLGNTRLRTETAGMVAAVLLANAQ